MIDTHCHLDMYDDDRDSVIQRAKDSGIEALITIGSDFDSNFKNISIAEKYDFVYVSVGIHPHDAKDFSPEIFEQLKIWTSPPFCSTHSNGVLLGGGKVVSIGETGLDYHYDHSPRDIQMTVFRKHLEIAKEKNLPVIVHSREAKTDTLDILRESNISSGILHCFSGDIDMAEKAMEMGLFISIAGPVTFKNAKNLQEIAKHIPGDYLLIETDAPFLTPEPLRGRRNEPSYISNTAKKIAELRGVSADDIARITTVNAMKLFRIGTPLEGEIAYKIRDNLYLNITNRCTNKCSFCIRFHSDHVRGHNLRLSKEPTEEELREAIGDPSKYREIVFCGYGEPLLRLDIVKKIARWIKDQGGHVRINTNGHGNLINKKNILPELKGIVDSISVSLDAHDEDTYNKICTPIYNNAYKEVISFIKQASEYISEVQITVVELEGVDIEKCRELAVELGVKFRIRKFNVVG